MLIGVAAVISMLALGKGAQNAIEEQLSSLGSNLLLIRPGAARVGGVSQDSGVANRLLYEDIRQLQLKVPEIYQVSGNISGRAQITAQGKNWNTSVSGTSATWAEMKSLQPTLGRFFIDQENTQRARVAVIGETIRKELFKENQTVIGEMIKINKVNFQIIGVLPEKGSNGWQDQDDRIIIPVLTGMYRLFGRNHIESIEAEIDVQENMENAQDKIKQILLTDKKIPSAQQDDAFTIRNMADIQQALQSSSKTMSLLLSAIAAISLLVGGIGIMNIMLVSVTERTKEIGLRKAVGAKQNDILIQFLSESAVISVVGGIFGIILGWAITIALSRLAGWTTFVSLSSVLLATVFSIVIGIVFGVYPARKASKLNPIDALRFE
ncbi:MAG: ABC transporter permease [Pseudobdellovibrionaceae bacterium]